MFRFLPFRSTALMALAIALHPAAAPAQDGETLVLTGDFNMSRLVPTVGADLAGVYANGGAHQWRLTLHGVSYSYTDDIYHDGIDYVYATITRVHATSFTLEFIGPDAATLNQIVSGQLGGGGHEGGAILDLWNVDIGYKHWRLSLAPLDAAGVKFAVHNVYDYSGWFPTDEWGWPVVPQQLIPESTAILDYRDGATGYLQSYGGVVNINGGGGDGGGEVTPLLSIAGASVVEGNRGATRLSMTVTLTSVSAETVTVNYQTADGTAVAGKDYVSTSGTLTFQPGETTKTITMSVKGDRQREPNETFTVQLSSAIGGVLGDAVGIGTILNDD
jgi:hypothetical protein